MLSLGLGYGEFRVHTQVIVSVKNGWGSRPQYYVSLAISETGMDSRDDMEDSTGRRERDVIGRTIMSVSESWWRGSTLALGLEGSLRSNGSRMQLCLTYFGWIVMSFDLQISL